MFYDITKVFSPKHCTIVLAKSGGRALFERTNNGKVHIKNLQKLLLPIFKCLSKEGPSFVWTFFERMHINYELRTTLLQ